MIAGHDVIADQDVIAGHDVIAGYDRKCSLPVRKRSELLSPGQMIDLVPEMDGGSGVGDDW